MFFNQRPDDLTPDDVAPLAEQGVSTGFATTFGEGFRAAYDQQAHVMGALGADADMADLEQQNLDRIYALTGKRFQPLFHGAFNLAAPTADSEIAIMQGLNGDQLTGARQRAFNDAQRQIKTIASIASEHPEILDYAGMLKTLQARAKKAGQTEADVSARSGFMGWLGGLAGGAAGWADPRYNPASIATAALGGFGKTALVRIASEMGVGGLTEAYSLLTGSAQNRELLTGEKSTAGEAAAEIASAGIGAGVLRGAGEGVGAGFRAIARRFGSRAADVTSAAIAKEAEEVAGPSPYGKSAVATGLHHAELRTAMANDAPLNMPGAARFAPGGDFTLGDLAMRENDQIFAGTAQPLSRIFDVIPQHVLPTLEKANAAITKLTERVNTASAFADEAAEKVKAAQAEHVAPDAISQRLSELDRAIPAATDKRALGRLTKEKAELTKQLGRATARANDLQALVQQADFAASRANDLRLKRAAIVRDAARRVPGVRSSTVAKRLTAPAAIAPHAPRSLAEDVTATMAAPEPEALTPKITRREPEPGELAAGGGPIPPAGEVGSGETVDIGQMSGPVDLDHADVIGIDADGKPVFGTLRELLADLREDDNLVSAMRTCLI